MRDTMRQALGSHAPAADESAMAAMQRHEGVFAQNNAILIDDQGALLTRFEVAARDRLLRCETTRQATRRVELYCRRGQTLARGWQTKWAYLGTGKCSVAATRQAVTIQTVWRRWLLRR